MIASRNDAFHCRMFITDSMLGAASEKETIVKVDRSTTVSTLLLRNGASERKYKGFEGFLMCGVAFRLGSNDLPCF